VLTAEGAAPHQWLREFRGRLPAIPGIVQFREKDLVDRDLEELAAVKERLENTVLRFETSTNRLLPDQSGAVGDLVEQARRFQLLAKVVGVSFRMEVVGHADASGQETENIRLSQKRADEIRAMLVSKGIDRALLHAVGAGSTQPVRQELSDQDRGFNRSVTFKLRLRESIEQKS
jgi:outer membrane protein OmpA-like peptidoglycan-associated protein